MTQDDRSAIRQKWKCLLHREKQAFDIDVEGPVVEFLGDRAESGKLCDPGIGEHNIESTLLLLDVCIETIKVAKIRHVSLYARPTLVSIHAVASAARAASFSRGT